MPNSILVVSNFFPPNAVGGAEIVAFRQAKALSARGHSVTVLAGTEPSKRAPAGRLDFDHHEGLPVYRLPLRSLGPDRNFWWPAASRILQSLVKTRAIDVVHIHNPMGLGADLIPAAKVAGARCIVTLHDHWGFCFRATRLRTDDTLCNNHEECAGCLGTIGTGDFSVPMRLRRDYVLWCLSHADRLITPSAYLAEAYQDAGLPTDQFSTISNGIDLDAIPGSPKSTGKTIRFLCSAYLGEHKGFRVLLQAVRQLAQRSDLSGRWHLTIAGDGHLRHELEAGIREAGLTGNVQLAGRLPRQKLLALLQATDVAILPSIWPENEPVSMLEAIASGTAQIATRIGGSGQLVDDEKSGVLVPPGDATALAEAMARYITTPRLAEEHGSYNLRRRRDFDQAQLLPAVEVLLTGSGNHEAGRSGVSPAIVCGSASPPPPVLEFVQHLYKHLTATPGPRLIWHEWADSEVWRATKLLWLWDRHPSEALINTALRRGIPVLAPSSAWTEGLARHYSGIIRYRTYLEALSAIRLLFAVPDLMSDLGRRAQTASFAATSLASRASFALGSETLS